MGTGGGRCQQGQSDKWGRDCSGKELQVRGGDSLLKWLSLDKITSHISSNSPKYSSYQRWDSWALTVPAQTTGKSRISLRRFLLFPPGCWNFYSRGLGFLFGNSNESQAGMGWKGTLKMIQFHGQGWAQKI